MAEPRTVGTCAAFLSMYEGEYEGECERPAEHDAPHWDGMTSWRTDKDGDTDWDTIDLPDDRRAFVEPST